MLQHSVTVQTRTGDGQDGPMTADPVVVPQVMVTKQGKRYITPSGAVAVSTAEVYGAAELGPQFVLGSLVTLPGETDAYQVVQVQVWDLAGWPSSMLALLGPS
jgi:hypothetical protein